MAQDDCVDDLGLSENVSGGSILSHTVKLLFEGARPLRRRSCPSSPSLSLLSICLASWLQFALTPPPGSERCIVLRPAIAYGHVLQSQLYVPAYCLAHRCCATRQPLTCQ
jgi:hypothetical protein